MTARLVPVALAAALVGAAASASAATRQAEPFPTISVADLENRAGLKERGVGHRLALIAAAEIAILGRYTVIPTGGTLVVTGKIEHPKVSPGSLGVTLRVTDMRANMLIGGAAIYAPHAEDAAREAARRLAEQRPAEGVILASVAQQETFEVLANRGTRDGVRKGDRAIVIHKGKLGAILKVAEVYPTDCEFTILDNPGGLQAEDQVVFEFHMPPYAPAK